MTEIWIDPTELKANADVLSQQAGRIQEAMTGTQSACACEAPRSMIGWIDDELVAITRDALLAALGYVTQALDSVVRADQIQADQSLAGTQPGLVSPTSDLTAGWLGDMVTVGGTGDAWSMPSGLEQQAFTYVGGTPSSGLLSGAFPGIAGMSGFSTFMDIVSRQGDLGMTALAPPGLTYSSGMYEDGAGNRASSYANAYVEPGGDYDLTGLS